METSPCCFDWMVRSSAPYQSKTFWVLASLGFSPFWTKLRPPQADAPHETFITLGHRVHEPTHPPPTFFLLLLTRSKRQRFSCVSSSYLPSALSFTNTDSPVQHRFILWRRLSVHVKQPQTRTEPGGAEAASTWSPARLIRLAAGRPAGATWRTKPTPACLFVFPADSVKSVKHEKSHGF